MEYSAPREKLSAEDLYGLPDDGRKYELVEGWLVSEPLPGGRHGRVAAEICSRLREHCRSRHLGVVYIEDTGFILARSPDTVRGPDVAFISRERFEEIGDTEAAIPGPPDLAVEVLSPSYTRSAIREKVLDYLVAGARMVWIVDPTGRTVTVYRTPFSPGILHGDDELSGEDVIPGFSVRVAELFEI